MWMSASSGVCTPERLIAFLSTVSCCSRLVCGNGQILLRGIQLRFRARDFDLRQRAERNLFLVVFEKLLRGGQRLLARCQILMETHQIPIQIQHRRNRSDHLLLELQIGDLQVVLLHPDVAPIHRASEALQQVLRDLQIQIAARVRIQIEEWLFTLVCWLA